jgi:hypothetical protein
MEKLVLKHIQNMILKERFIISNHARTRMFQRNISTDKLIEVVNNSTIIEEYPDDNPCPSVLLLGFVNREACHVVVANCTDHARIITIYYPAKDKWIEDKIRIDKQ